MRKIISILCALLCSVPVFAEEDQDFTFSRRLGKTVERGLKFLSLTQEPNGSWRAFVGRKVHNEYRGKMGYHVGVTSLVCMSFMAGGSLPGRGLYGENVQKGLEFVLNNVGSDGFISAYNSRMYSHAFATLFLSEVYGTTKSARVRDALEKAVKLVVTAQNAEGGWRYMPGQPDSDMCVTVCQVQSLRSARNVGIFVPKKTIDSAIEYVKRSWDKSTGGFFYQRGVPSRVSFALTAAGLTALYGSGYYEGLEVEGSVMYLSARKNWPKHYMASRTFDYYYGHYFGVQAAFQRGGKFWTLWRRRVVDEIIQNQSANGSWNDLVGLNYATAMATLILQIPYQYLPIFER